LTVRRLEAPPRSTRRLPFRHAPSGRGGASRGSRAPTRSRTVGVIEVGAAPIGLDQQTPRRIGFMHPSPLNLAVFPKGIRFPAESLLRPPHRPPAARRSCAALRQHPPASSCCPACGLLGPRCG